MRSGSSEPVHRLVGLYWGDEQREAIRKQRQRLLWEALALHREGRYAATIPIVLSQIDGIFIDMTGETTTTISSSRRTQISSMTSPSPVIRSACRR